MRGFSKAIIAGNLTRDPELRTTTSGTSVCSFSVAVNRNSRDASGNQRTEVSYLDCTAWGNQGETISKYLHKGSPILLSGRLQQRSWDDKTTGAKRSRVEIVVEDFVFIGGDRGDGAGGNFGGSSSFASSNAGSNAKKSTDSIPSDIPEGEISLDDVPFDVPADVATEVSEDDIPF